MKDMQERYGTQKGKSVFYATANKMGMKEHLTQMKKKGKLKAKKC